MWYFCWSFVHVGKLRITFFKYLRFEKIVASPFNSFPRVVNGTRLKSRITLFHSTKVFHFLLQRTSLPEFSWYIFFLEKSKSKKERFFSIFFIGIVSSNSNSHKLLPPWSFIWLDQVGSTQIGRYPPNSNSLWVLELIIYYLVEISYLVGISYRMTHVQMRELSLSCRARYISVIALCMFNRIQTFLPLLLLCFFFLKFILVLELLLFDPNGHHQKYIYENTSSRSLRAPPNKKRFLIQAHNLSMED